MSSSCICAFPLAGRDGFANPEPAGEEICSSDNPGSTVVQLNSEIQPTFSGL